MKQRRLQPRDYTVGWICALPIELAAAQEMLDEEHERPTQDSLDPNVYTLGSIGDHNVVLACLPAGQMGTQPAATVAARMRFKFTSIRFGLMVGIGGGVPSAEADIRLGDVVISQPHLQHGGVVQYDSGKTGACGNITRTGWLNAPPSVLLHAISELRALHYRGRSNLATYLSTFDRLENFSHSTAGPDVLFEASYNHIRGATCKQCSKEKEVKRTPRKGPDVVVHYGTIASGNQVIKDSITRDTLSAELGGVMCFEMEAAGLMNDFPCLVVRGICDYTDSHKNKRWQPYAAATAAACAKEILSITPAAEVPTAGTARSAVDISWGGQQNTIENRDSAWYKQLCAKLLQSVKFREIRDRQDRIAKAITRTFEWIYREPDPDAMQWANFIEWLEHGSGLYWINGKAGSGKSTLMKFLHSDPRTNRCLDVWAGDSKLVIAGFFFWNSGSSIQMSLGGLIRTLMHDIATALPDLVPSLFPERWEELESCHDLHSAKLQSWSSSECLRTFRRLLDPQLQSHKFFFFIDGMDECSGDHREMIGLLKEMADSQHIKMCLASRPWVIFQDAFDTKPSLTLQHLTSPDINIFVRAKFYEDPHFLQLEKHEPQIAAQFCKDITQKSSGVFLWVRIVVQSLLTGITNGDRVTDLRKRLDELPEDLELLFQKIIDSIDPFYKQHASQLFQIHRAAWEYNGVTLLRLSFADEDNEGMWQECGEGALRDEEIRFRIQMMKKRLDSRTKGLLEVPTWSGASEKNGNLLQYRQSLSFDKTSTVQYLHRTLKDFIEMPKIWNYLCAASGSFDPYVSLCKAYALEAKLMDMSKSPITDLVVIVERAINNCCRAQKKSDTALIPLLDMLNTAITAQLKRINNRWIAKRSKDHAVLMPLTIRHDLAFWVEALLKRGHPTSPGGPGIPYLLVAVDAEAELDMPWNAGKDSNKGPSSKCVLALLEAGANPHERYREEPIWKFVRHKIVQDLRSLAHGHHNCSAAPIDTWLDVAETFARHGADPDSLRRLISPEWITNIKSRFPAQIDRLMELWSQPERQLRWSHSGRQRKRKRV